MDPKLGWEFKLWRSQSKQLSRARGGVSTARPRTLPDAPRWSKPVTGTETGVTSKDPPPLPGFLLPLLLLPIPVSH